jgi:hypothetical protein
MPNGFHGPKEEWDRLEAPYVRIDPLLAAFAGRHGIQVNRNYRGADRSLRYHDALSRAIWVHATDKYGANGTYEVSVIAHQDRPDRFIKVGHVAKSVAIDDLDRVLEQAAGLVSSWTAEDLGPAKGLREQIADEVAEIAGTTARKLNMPWNPDLVVSKPLFRLWPLPRRWRVVSRVPTELAETTIIVEEGTGRAFPQRVRHTRK